MKDMFIRAPAKSAGDNMPISRATCRIRKEQSSFRAPFLIRLQPPGSFDLDVKSAMCVKYGVSPDRKSNIISGDPIMAEKCAQLWTRISGRI